MDLKLAPITAENWRSATLLTTDPERKIPLDEQWIANNAFSLHLFASFGFQRTEEMDADERFYILPGE